MLFLAPNYTFSLKLPLAPSKCFFLMLRRVACLYNIAIFVFCFNNICVIDCLFFNLHPDIYIYGDRLWDLEKLLAPHIEKHEIC